MQDDTARLTYAIIELMDGVPGQIALSALVSATLTIICQSCAQHGAIVAQRVSEQIATEYATAARLLGTAAPPSSLN